MNDLRKAAQAVVDLWYVGAIGDVDIESLRAALSQPEFPPHGDTIQEGDVYWYVGKDGEYYSSNQVKLFLDAKTRALYQDPPQWRLDKGDLIPLYTAPPWMKA